MNMLCGDICLSVT